MLDRPILIFPEAINVPERDRRRSSPPADLVLPERRDQAKELLPKFRELLRKLRDKELAFRSDPAGATPAQILVFELISTTTDFYRVVRKINGLQWLLDDDAGRTDPGEDFFVRDDPTLPLYSRVLVVSANQTALSELLRLFQMYRRNQKLPYGFGPFVDLFAHVRDVRPWEFRDRIEGTGIARYVEELAKIDLRDLLCGIELFSTGVDDDDRAAVARVVAEIESVGGVSHCTVSLSQIRHGEIRATIPLRAIPSIAALRENRIFHLDDVMFVRPTAQAGVVFDEQLSGDEVATRPSVVLEVSPRLALFDGVPIQNHPMLSDRIFLDDPDDYESQALVSQRLHGTAMASIVLNGDLSATDPPLTERIYVRPILLPQPTLNGHAEKIPETAIPVDLLHRAVVRLFEGSGAIAPSVRVICLCVADSTRPLDPAVSPWARLVDYLSWKYGVLFLLSAGNYAHRLIIPTANFDPASISASALDAAMLESFVSSASSRPIMSPGEAVNAITVAAASEDASSPLTHAIVPLSQDGRLRPALFNAVGYGYRRAVKPDLLYRGGRMAVRVSNQADPGTTGFDPVLSLLAPGNEVAAPPRTTGFLRGTSNASAFAGRDALELLTFIETLSIGSPGDRHLDIALLKALMAHTASWGSAYNALKNILRSKVRVQALRQNVARYVGYGFPDVSRVRECTESRVTVVAADRVLSEQAMVYRFPLPPAMAAKAVRKRLIVTLAYLCPMSSSGRIYRTHNVWASTTFKGDELKDTLNLRNQQVHEPYVGLGTLQHEIFVGQGAVAFVDGDGLQLRINCKRDSGERIVSGIPFGLAATLELLDSVGADIYQEIRDRMAVPVEIAGVPVNI